jgi:sulfur carrier protein
MNFNLKFKDIDEKRELSENYTIKNLLDDLGLNSQTVVAKQNGELTIEENEINDEDEIKLIQIIYGG